ncbi:MAG: ribulose-phosphate 3-epimerase [Mageeibacillus sp.]|jgi:ribulose-phosphate 3-epimerase|nr:ribulose-phosphate 3-epimerase [Mageeibacillus sp.]MCI1263375.1 ribulose-phosphate 3-epimerase [Saccharofermentans sp.]MCI1769044.1 ribulose-phosphate 3-epimerase [Mageeibacillus sp.]MCI2043972.1 ribulose-phosphate 3-epimerase [Mageeibacillus sp.]
MSGFDIAPSLLSADFCNLERDIKKVEGRAEYLHLDIMDGHYVSNISFGLPVVKSIRKATGMIFDTHLMITEPEKYVDAFAAAGSDIITFHIECTDEPEALVDHIRASGCKAGIAIHPDTDIERLIPMAGRCDLILVMSVRPGFGGQGYLDGSTSRIARVRNALDECNSGAILAVDGGINAKTIREAYDAGARLFVAGNAVFGSDDPGRAIEELKACITR